MGKISGREREAFLGKKRFAAKIYGYIFLSGKECKRRKCVFSPEIRIQKGRTMNETNEFRGERLKVKWLYVLILFFTLFLLIAAPATRKTVKEGNDYISLMNR